MWTENIFSRRKKKDSFFHIYDHAFHEINHVGVQGRGNNEWIAPFATGQSERQKGRLGMYILERPSCTLRLWPLNGDERPMSEHVLKHHDLASIRYLFKTGEDTFIGASDDNECNFFCYDAKTKRLERRPHPKCTDIGSSQKCAQLLLQTLATYNPVQKRVACTYFSFPLLVIRDDGGNVLRKSLASVR